MTKLYDYQTAIIFEYHTAGSDITTRQKHTETIIAPDSLEAGILAIGTIMKFARKHKHTVVSYTLTVTEPTQ